jgi:hypothetical protein
MSCISLDALKSNMNYEMIYFHFKWNRESYFLAETPKTLKSIKCGKLNP